MKIEAELLERVKAATGPDRELSRDVWHALDTPEWKQAYLRAQEPCGCPHKQAVEYAIRYLDDVTASIDAAFALVKAAAPDWFVYRIDNWHNYDHDAGGAVDAGYGVHLWRRMKNKDHAYDAIKVGWLGATIPLAIVAAVLTARAQP